MKQILLYCVCLLSELRQARLVRRAYTTSKSLDQPVHSHSLFKAFAAYTYMRSLPTENEDSNLTARIHRLV